MTKRPFNQKEPRTKEILGSIYTDVCGPMTAPTRSGYEYFTCVAFVCCRVPIPSHNTLSKKNFINLFSIVRDINVSIYEIKKEINSQNDILSAQKMSPRGKLYAFPKMSMCTLMNRQKCPRDMWRVCVRSASFRPTFINLVV